MHDRAEQLGRLTTALAARYRIEHELGRGGMATVYLAEDLKHERAVALKVLQPELAAVLGPDRFLREIKTTANLHHPHILALYDSDEADGFLYYVMPYVEGESLRDRLNRERPLPVTDALHLAREVADALSYAHARGVIHRDIKPENILLDSRHAMVADFGIARAVSTAGGDRLTATGLAVGTPAYMSPEQAAGEDELDGRSDLYSLGCVLFEMLTGEAPFTGPSLQAVLAKRFTDSPVDVSTLRPGVPSQVCSVVRTLLAREQTDRFASAEEVVNMLREASNADVTAGDGRATDMSVAVPPSTHGSVPLEGGRTALVGREKEVAALDRMLDEAVHGRGAFVLLGGEPGVGKTRLAEEVLRNAYRRGMLALTGRAYEDETAPFVMTTEILEEMVRRLPAAELRPMLGDNASELSRLLPELRQLFLDIPEPLDVPSEQKQRYLFKSVLDVLTRASGETPVIMLLDDIHWADESSLLLLEHIASRVAALPILMIGTYRDAPADMGEAFTKTMATLVRRRLAERMQIKQLAEPAVADLLATLGGENPPAELVAKIYRNTEGNAFYVEEVFRHLTEEGALFDENGHWRSNLAVVSLDVPEGVRLVTGRRLDRLDESTRKMLTTAAAIGLRFDLRILQAADDPETIIEATEEAEAAQLIRTTARHEARYEFSHALVRQTLLSAVSLPRMQVLHLRVADAMERVYGARADEHAAELANQLSRAGAAAAPDRTRRYLRLAGDQAFATGAPDEAIEYYGRALSLLNDAASTEGAELRFARGEASRALGRWNDAASDWEEALPVLESNGKAELVARICRELAYQQVWQNETERAKEIVARGLRAVGDGPSPGRSRLLAIVGHAHSLAEEFEQSEHVNDRAMAIAGELGDEQLQSGEVLLARVYMYQHSLRPAKMAATAERAIELARRSARPWDVSNALGGAFFAWLLQGRLDVIDEQLDEALELAEREGDLGNRFHLNFVNGLTLLMRAQLSDAREAVQRSVDVCREASFPWITASQSTMAMIDFYAGRWDAARSMVDEAMAHRLDGTWTGFEPGHELAVLAYADPTAARSKLELYRERLPAPGAINAGGAWTLSGGFVQAAAALGQREAAAELHAPFCQLIDEGGLVLWSFGLTEKLAGIAAAAGGQWETAEGHFQTALQQAHELPNRVDQAEARRWYARMRRERNGHRDADRARTMLAEARAVYQDIGMPKHVALVQ